jgi:RNA polymerase sigma-70 factor (ECF subfamily)
MTREQLERELADLNAISFGWALSCCRWDPEEARDVLQIAYLRALETAHAFNGDATARCWFFGIVRNTAAERRRAGLIRGAALKRWLLREPAPPPGPSPEHLSHREQTGRVLRRLLLELSRRQREVLHLVFYEDLTVEQAALVLGLPIGTARKHYQRGKLRLRRLLSEVQP